MAEKKYGKYVFQHPIETGDSGPKGFIHCPMIFTRVDKPILLIHATLASKYEKAEIYK